MTATVTGGTTATRSPAPAPRTPGRRRLRLPRASTTPGQVRLIRAGLVVLCLGWGALAGLMVGQHASAAGDATSTSEPLSLDAQQMYQSLADADVTVAAALVVGFFLYRSQRWLSRRTHRMLNVGLLLASVAGAVGLAEYR